MGSVINVYEDTRILESTGGGEVELKTVRFKPGPVQHVVPGRAWTAHKAVSYDATWFTVTSTLT